MKKCVNCGSQNSDENNFCSNCGSELNVDLGSNSISCNKCGTQNDQSNSFCLNCGAKLNTSHNAPKQHKRISSKQTERKKRTNKHNSHQHNSKSANKSFFQSTKSVWIIAGIIIGSLAIAGSFDLVFHKYPDSRNNSPINETISTNPAVTQEVYSVASKFTCACGKCNEPLTECTCKTAEQERSLIKNYFKNNKSQEKIVQAVINKYGGYNSKLLN